MAATAPSPQSPIEVVAQLVQAIEEGDLAAVRTLYAPGAVVWTCFDDHERDTDGSLGVLDWFVSTTSERHYEVTRRIEIEGGVLQQHVLHATAKSGKTFSMAACLVIRLDGNLITRIDEYLDPKPVTAALG